MLSCLWDLDKAKFVGENPEDGDENSDACISTPNHQIKSILVTPAGVSS